MPKDFILFNNYNETKSQKCIFKVLFIKCSILIDQQ